MEGLRKAICVDSTRSFEIKEGQEYLIKEDYELKKYGRYVEVYGEYRKFIGSYLKRRFKEVENVKNDDGLKITDLVEGKIYGKIEDDGSRFKIVDGRVKYLITDGYYTDLIMILDFIKNTRFKEIEEYKEITWQEAIQKMTQEDSPVYCKIVREDVIKIINYNNSYPMPASFITTTKWYEKVCE